MFLPLKRTLDFDDRFLAKRSVSWSTLGKERNANKPYRELLENSNAFDTLDFSAFKSINNKAALIERLDNLTCAGCHQSAGTAGFHFLGKPRDEFSHSFNRQELALSPHAHAEVSRRSQYIKALLEDDKDNASDIASFLKYRPHSMMPSAIFKDKAIEYEDLTVGASCSLGVLKDAPTCAAGLECRRTISSKHEALFGECVLEKQTSPEGYFAGGACIQGEITEVDTNIADKNPPTYNFFAFRDKFTITGRVHNNLGNGKNRYSCASPKSGAPLGRRGRACTANEESFKTLDDFGKGDNQRGLAGTELRGKEIPNELCANKGGNGFDTCAASGNAGACLESRVARAKLDSCSTTRFCREDYICQKFPEYQHISITDYGRKRRGIPVNMVKPTDIDGNIIAELHEQGVGFCVPTYFLFNMRVDGHPNPETGKAPGPPRIDRSQPLRGYK